MKSLIIIVAGALALVSAPGVVAEAPATEDGAEEKRTPQTHCPVMGGEINEEEYVDVKGRRIYVCCPGCKETIRKDPDTYIEKLETEGVDIEEVGKPQTHCPVMGGKIDSDLYVDVNGKRIYVCCRGCISAIESNPDKYIERLREHGYRPEDAPEK